MKLANPIPPVVGYLKQAFVIHMAEITSKGEGAQLHIIQLNYKNNEGLIRDKHLRPVPVTGTQVAAEARSPLNCSACDATCSITTMNSLCSTQRPGSKTLNIFWSNY